MSYGQQVLPPPPLQYGGQPKKSNGMAVAGFVLALLGALGSFIPFINIFFAFLAVLGLIFGTIGLVKSSSLGAGKGMSIAAIILSVLAVVISLVFTFAAARWIGAQGKVFEAAHNTAAPVTGRVGQSVKDGDFTFVVKSVKCGMTTYAGSLPLGSRDEFCAVEISVLNHGKDAQAFDEGQVQGFIAGRMYEANYKATRLANPNLSAFRRSIRPGSSIQVVVLMDVPVGKQLDTVELHDSILSDGTSVSVP
jgi:Domain of unknown function (DUF4352)